MGGGGSEIEGSGRTSVDIDNTLHPDPFLRSYTKASRSYAYKIWEGCKGRLFRKMRCTPGVVG